MRASFVHGIRFRLLLVALGLLVLPWLAAQFIGGMERSLRTAQEQALTDMYHEWGYKVTTYVNSFVCQDHPEGAYQQGDAHGWFVKTAAGTTYPVPYAGYRNSSSAVVDFRAPGAVPWWQGLISEAINNGYDGWIQQDRLWGVYPKEQLD